MHCRVQQVARMYAESAANRAGQNNLSFGGNSGLHGKTILPQAER